MNDYFWHIDAALLKTVEKPLVVMGIVFGVLVVINIALVIRSLKNSRDDHTNDESEV